MPPECQLFGTLGCHLCELAEEELMPLVEHGLLVELIDIAENEDWVEDYGLRIPVLRRVDTGAELDWPFDAEQIVAFCVEQRSTYRSARLIRWRKLADSVTVCVYSYSDGLSCGRSCESEDESWSMSNS